MNSLQTIISELNNGNKQVIQEVIVSTRLHVLNTARSIVKKDEDAIAIASDVYNELFLNPQNFKSEDSFIEYLNTLINEKSKKYTNVKNKFKKKKSQNQKVDLDKINIDDFKGYYNNPKIEKIIYETINSLPNEEKAIVIDNFFFNLSLKDISKKYGIDEETVKSYLDNANILIDKKSKPLFIKNKIINADYSGIAVVYSTVKLGLSIMSLDILGIAVDKIEDEFKDDEKEDDKKDLKEFIQDIIEDLVKDWFLERIKSAIITGIAAATAANISSAKAAKTVGISLVKRIAIGAVTAAVVTTGAVTVYNISQNTYDKKIEKVESVVPDISINSTYQEMPIALNVYCDQGSEEISSIFLDIDISNEEIETAQLELIEVSSKVVSGLDVFSQENSEYTTVHVVVEKEKLNQNLISFIESLDIVDQDVLDKAKELLESDKNELIAYLVEYGFVN